MKRGRPVSIQTQLLLGTGIILALASIIAVVGYATLRQLQTGIQTTLQEASQIRESSLLIENEFLTTRQNEASFLSNWQTLGYETAFEQYVVPGTSHLETAGAELDRIGQLVRTAHDSNLRSLIAETSDMGPLLDNYKTAFLTTVAQVEQRTRGGGLEKDLASELSWLEKAVAPLPKAELLTLVLQLRASEQAYLNTGRQEYADNVRLLIDRFTTLVENSSEADLTPVSPGENPDPRERAALIAHAASYSSLFTRISNLDQDIKVNTTIFREITTDITDITASISQKSETGLAQAQEELQQVVRRSTLALIATTALALGLGVVAVILLARRIAGPLGQLGQTAQRMGEGDLSPAAVAGPTEVVTLGGALNTMAGQLRDLIGSLEQRVAERTRSLEAAAEVSQATTSVLDPEELLRQVAELVRERFNLYYVGLFLTQQETDEKSGRAPREWAVLRAGTGEAGQQMLAGGHRLAAGGESMIGWCITHGQARIALDVGHEAARFDNPLLPETRSEMALPLRSRGRVIGAMTVQSRIEAAFDEADVAVMQTMADQVAVAIDNAHLFAETEAALKEMETVHRSYMRETWSEYLHVAETTGYDTAGLGTVSRQEIEQAMAGRGPAAVDREEAGLHSALVAPIMLRDEVIGVLGIHDQAGAGPPRKWTEDEMRMVEGVANRLALAAENLRLLDETRRRAARERLAREITDQIRAAVSVEDAVQRAMQGMSRALGASEMVARIGTEQDLLAGQGGDGHE